MANEAVLITETHFPVNKICADGLSIEKGTLLTLSGANEVRATTASDSGTIFGGIAFGEKIANDGITSISVYDRGKFSIIGASGGSITLGEIVAISGANSIRTATAANIASGAAVGKALGSVVNAEGNIEVMVGYV